MKCSIKKRELPPLPKVTTKQVHNNHIYGFGRHTYEYNESAPALDLQIPPTRSDSQASQSEREMKIILDLARQGKTASQIAEESGYNQKRVVQVVKRFAEYGAKLTPEPRKKRKPSKYNAAGYTWTDEMVEQLITLHRQGMTFAQIGDQIGVTKNSISAKVRVLVEDGVLESRTGHMAWSPEDMELMFNLRAQGKTWGEIADKLGRKITACQNAYKREGERRKCLKG